MGKDDKPDVQVEDKKDSKAPEDKKKLHVKPSKEELEEGALKAAKEAEELKDKKPEEDEVKEEEVKEETKEPEEEEPKVDYKKKFKASTQEAQILHAKNKKITEALERASQLAEPTEEELKAEYSEWDDMSDFEKKMAKQTLVSTRRLNSITEVTRDFKDLEKWQQDVDKFVDDPKTLVDNPKLEGKTDDFRVFATKPTRRGVDFEDLINAFLYEVEEERKAMPSNKGKKMMETGTGGPSDKGKPKGGKIGYEEGRLLRKTNYEEFKRLLKAGKIETPEF